MCSNLDQGNFQLSLFECSFNICPLFHDAHAVQNGEGFDQNFQISVFRLLAHNLKPVHIVSDHDFFVIEGPLKHFERSTIIINLCCYISDHLELLLNEIMETDNEKMWMGKYDNSLILFNSISIWLNKFIAMKHSDQCGSCYYNQNRYNTILVL